MTDLKYSSLITVVLVFTGLMEILESSLKKEKLGKGNPKKGRKIAA